MPPAVHGIDICLPAGYIGGMWSSARACSCSALMDEQGERFG